MVRNTKESALIVHRHGKLSEMPHSLNESEIGFATDENRVFIGNPKHVDLAEREEFPYQNLELLTEFSDLLNYIKYRYTNNIQIVDGDTDREFYQENLPIVVEGSKTPIFSQTITLTLSNGSYVSDELVIEAGSTLAQAISIINNIKNQTHIIAEDYNGKLILVGYGKELIIAGTNIANLGLVTQEDSEVLLPYRKVNEKLDDNLSIKDYAYKTVVDGETYYHHIDGNGTTDVGQGIYTAIIGAYAKSEDAQFKRNIFFPTGKYIVGDVYSAFPILNGMSLVGEGIDRTIISVTEADKNKQLFTTKEQDISNITIKDMTIDCTNGSSVEALMSINKCSNLFFENVKFVGSCNYGFYNINESKNIVFKHCIFNGFKQAIYSTGSLTNVTIEDCIFDSYTNYAINLEATASTNYIKGCKIFGNTFTNGGSDYAIRIDGNGTVEYNTIINNIFDKEVIEQQDSKKPLNSGKFGAGKKNYTDILDPTLDTRKALLFNFAQPRWDYISYLKSTGDDIIFETDNEHVVVINDNGAIAYEDRIADKDNAVATVAYVNKATQSGTSITNITYDSISEGVVPLATIPEYSTKVRLLEIMVSVAKPFGKIYSYLDDAVTYTSGSTYYNGDIVKQTVDGIVKYGVVIANHKASSSIVNDNVVLVDSGLTDIKYADIVAIKDDNEYSLTRCGINNELTIDLQALDINEYAKKSFIEGTAYNGVVSYQDKLYNANMTSAQSTVANLHNTSLAQQIEITGYNYNYDFDRKIIKNNSVYNSCDVNFGGCKLVMKFYDANGNLITVSDKKNLNPSGNMFVTVKYIKTNETPIIKKTYTLTINPTPSDANVVLTADGYTQEGNSITVEEGTVVSYEVSKDGYTTKSDVIIINEDKTLDIELEVAPKRNYIETDGYEYTNENDMVTLTKYIGSNDVVLVPTIEEE